MCCLFRFRRSTEGERRTERIQQTQNERRQLFVCALCRVRPPGRCSRGRGGGGGGEQRHAGTHRTPCSRTPRSAGRCRTPRKRGGCGRSGRACAWGGPPPARRWGWSSPGKSAKSTETGLNYSGCLSEGLTARRAVETQASLPALSQKHRMMKKSLIQVISLTI